MEEWKLYKNGNTDRRTKCHQISHRLSRLLAIINRQGQDILY